MNRAQREEMAREFLTMALYLAIVIFAELVAIPEGHRPDIIESVVLIWGTTVGLTLAHLFAFELSAAFVASGRPGLAAHHLALAQIAAAGAVAAVATLPVFVLSEEPGYEFAQGLLALLIGGTAFATARHGGASLTRSAAYTALLLVLASAIIALKASVVH